MIEDTCGTLVAGEAVERVVSQWERYSEISVERRRGVIGVNSECERKHSGPRYSVKE